MSNSIRRQRNIGDPRNQDRLAGRDIVKGEIVALINEYDSPEFIPCNIKSCHTPHKNGWTVLLKDETWALIGNVCRKRVLDDEEFTVLQRKHSELIANQTLSDILGRETFQPRLTLEALQGPWEDTLQAMQAARRNIRNGLTVFETLKDRIAKNDGELVQIKTERDQAREFREMERRSEGDKRPPPKYWIDISYPIWRVRGGEFLTASLDARNLLTDARQLLQTAIAAFEDPAPDGKNALEGVEQAIEAGRKMRLVANQFDQYESFRAAENLSGIANWLFLSHRIRANCSGDGMLVIYKGPNDVPEGIELPATHDWSRDDTAHVRR